jgi:hypothetical protein
MLPAQTPKKRRLEVNAYGLMKAEKFRKHFGFEVDFSLLSGDSIAYLNCHDFLHTHLGAKPTWDDGDEDRVVNFEDKLERGEIPLPKGLQWK